MSIKGIFGAGIPTKIDVDRIISTLGIPKAGDKIRYDQLETIIGITRDQYRYRTVVSAWRTRLEREHNLLFAAVMNEGYLCLDGAGRVEASASRYKGGLRRVTRAAEIAAKTDRATLNTEQKRTCDHIQNTGASLRLAAQQAARRIKWDGDEDEAK